MMRKSNIFLIGLLVLHLVCVSQTTLPATLSVIPKPKDVFLEKGNFTLSPETKIVAASTPALQQDITWFNEYLQRYYHITLEVVTSTPGTNYILFKEAAISEEEAYELRVTEKNITIQSKANGPGNFYALQTLVQLLPEQNNTSVLIPCLRINDAPRFPWRGMHLDVCRHFFSVAFLKRYIDLIALYKMNTFHWHLTDDQGWRIEIKKYPLLTSIGGWRKGTMVGPYSKHEYDSTRYGGFYTQEEIKEVVAYAAKKHITIVPEIEMPGHALAAIAAYPWLSCTGKQQEVEKGWGVFEDVFCTKDSVFNFLENVLDEVIILFPGKYIHIGGDESPKTRWKVCPRCQGVIKREKLKDEHELQSYFIKRIEAHVSSKGRKIIGWDEILEGGLAPNAAVMSWQGEEGGIAAAKQKHPVVMSPGSYCYFDHYQSTPAGEPLAIGGYTPLEKVYAFEPIPNVLTPAEQPYIMGAQANLWTEYILSEKQVEYMVLPRMAALAEVLWTSKEKKNETDFLARLQKHFLLLDKLHYNYSKSLYRIEYKLSPSGKAGSVTLQLLANSTLGDIHYTTDGSEPSINSLLYKEPLLINKDVTVKSALFKNNELKGTISTKTYQINKATNAAVTLKTPPHPSYNTGGAFTLVNGESATLPRISEQWLGWKGDDMEVTLKLEKEEEVHFIQAGFLNEELSWIYLPKNVEFLASPDGIHFESLGKVDIKQLKEQRFAQLNVTAKKTTYIKVIAKNFGEIPGGKTGAGERSWLFCDEIIIN